MENTKELKKNKFRIISDPYSREITYDYWDFQNEEWCSPADNSPFSKENLTKATIYHKAYDIIETALDKYGGNVGLEIYFEGTADEFNSLSGIADDYFSDKEIDIIKSDCYLNPVREVRRNIDTIFKDMKDTFDEYNSNLVKDIISKYEDTMNDTIPICVMGLYSTGKSAFINSLLGVEILPSADDPTTAKTFKISVGPMCSDYSISFRYQDESTPETTIKLELSGKKFKFNKTKDLNIVSEINKEVKEIESPYDKMYNTLSIINGYDKEYNKTKTENDKPWRVSPLVEVTLPLEQAYTVLPVDKYNFVIYDTPGSNSASNKDDKIVLKEAMDKQTNGLPIYVIASKKMDEDDNVELIETLKELGDSLDRNNLMIVVNQADDTAIKELESKKENFNNLAVSKLNPAGTYFVSSIMGLGSKMLMTERITTAEVEDNDGEMELVKAPCFLDSGYWEIFKKNKGNFVSIQNPKALYSYNIIPKPELDKYIKSVNPNDPNKRILYNSGIGAIGSAITDFAESYSLYNKCRNAGNYLSEAIVLTTNEIELKELEQEKLSQKLDNQLSAVQKALMEKILETIKNKRKEYETSIDSVIRMHIDNTLKELKNKEFSSYADTALKECHGLSKKDQFAEKMSSFLDTKMSALWGYLKCSADILWENQATNLKEEVIHIITAAPSLTDEQKSILKKTIKNIVIPAKFNFSFEIKPKDVVKGIIWIKLKKEAITNCVKIFGKETTRAISTIKTEWSDAYDRLRDSIKNESKIALTKHNPEVINIQNEIKRCQNEIKNLNQQKDYVSNKITELKELTEFKRLSENEE